MTGESGARPIVYVDNDGEALPIVERFLKMAGDVRVVSTLYDARAAVAETKPSLIVIDPDLPDGDGMDLIREVHTLMPWVQIFALLKPVRANRTRELIAAGAADVAVKPFDCGTIRVRAAGLLRAAEVIRKESALRREMAARLEHVERIATLGTLFATLAHEIATPLTVVSSNASMIEDLLSTDGPVAEDARAAAIECAIGIARSSGMIRDFIGRIRGFSRRDEASPKEGALTDVVEGAIALIKPKLQHRGVVVHRPVGRPPTIVHYPNRLTQALIALLNNALESPGVENVWLKWIGEGESNGFAVEDDGEGLGEGVASLTIKPFFTTKPKGTGLGLMIVDAIVRDHYGRFGLVPRAEGRGASARVLIPKVLPSGT